jgi:hypothetical protein
MTHSGTACNIIDHVIKVKRDLSITLTARPVFTFLNSLLQCIAQLSKCQINPKHKLIDGSVYICRQFRYYLFKFIVTTKNILN